MRIYLSNYWKKNCVFSIVIIIMMVIAVIMFCIWSYDDEDYILIAGILFFIILFSYLTVVLLKLVRHVIKENNQFVMYSFDGKKLSSLNFESDIYYELLPLIEGIYSTQNYIVISNLSFSSYRKKGFTKLAQICRAIDQNGNQIIIPYSEQVYNLVDMSRWHRIN